MSRFVKSANWRLGVGVQWRLLWLVAATAAAGGSSAVIWAFASFRPGYVVTEQLTAVQSENGLASVFAADALFVLLTAVGGLFIGVLAWLWFRNAGWWLFILTLAMATLLSVLCWQLGLALSPADFHERLALASPGDTVAIDLQLSAWSALLVAPFAAVIPLMLFSAVWPETPHELGEDKVAADVENL
ncbi:MAG: hypothetical protein CSA64_03040 [Arachnia propionica]|nr:MAG: hypothetical protein CSA64_03040 [Arachnia propionica]